MDGSSPSDGSGPSIAVDLLGPVSARIGGIVRPLTAGRQRSVLAYLAVNLGRSVAADEVLEAIWGDDLPDSGVKAVAFQVSKLRSALEPERDGQGTVVASTPVGYQLNSTAVIDVHEFARMVREASNQLANDPTASALTAEQALDLWRGEAFGDVNETHFVASERHHLEGRRLVARRTVAQARLALGDHALAAELLESLVAENPLDESLVEFLMLALHRGGRTADGLRVFAELRQRLSAELGIEPSRAAQQTELLLLGGQESPASTELRGSGIPAAVSTFVGRETEIARVGSLLEASRLVTLTGFGGLGKTRLAQEAAGAVANRRGCDSPGRPTRDHQPPQQDPALSTHGLTSCFLR